MRQSVDNRSPQKVKYNLRGSQLKRKLDHILGTPLLLALGRSRRKRRLPERILTVGILSCSAIGDTILASAIARDLKITFPGCKVIVFISPSVRGIISIVEGFDQEVCLVITKPVEAVRILRSHPTDVLFDITPWPRMTAIVVALARSRFTIGFQTDRQHRHFAYDAAVPHLASRHEVENYRALLAPLGMVGGLPPRARAELLSPGQQSKPREQVVVLHPWASGFRSTMREWPAARWAAVANEIIADGVKILITGGPSDRDRAEALTAMIDRPDRVTSVAGAVSLPETVREMANATLVISVNTGIMHLAAALDQNLVALHGPTNPVRWGPLSDHAVVVGPGQSEGGAFLNLGFEYPDGVADCMTSISVDEVLHHARRIYADEHVGAVRPVGASASRVVNISEDDYANAHRASSLTGVAEQRSKEIVDAVQVNSRPSGMPRPRGALFKRAEDLVCATLFLTLTAPMLLLIGCAIKLDSRGPVFFQQESHGYNGRVIRIYKFRSTSKHSEDWRGNARRIGKNDSNITRVGRFLRKYGLDALPQLFNVIKGEMSLIGPHPDATREHVADLLPQETADSYALRYGIKPGITGLAQINGTHEPLDSVETVVTRTNYDLLYIRSWSPLLDLKILAKAVIRMGQDNAPTRPRRAGVSPGV